MGFTFCGRHTSELGIEYVPKAGDMLTQIAPFETFSKDVPGKHGGYYYGNRVDKRGFELLCLLDAVDDATIAQVLGLFSRDQYGELEFDDRPGMKYWARPVEIADPKIYKHTTYGDSRWSGTLTVLMAAFEPFAHMDRIDVDDIAALDERDGFLKNHTGMLWRGIMPPLNHSGLIGQTKELLLYNPGNERAYLTIRAAGDVGENGLLIYNRNTKQRCKIVNLTAAETTAIDAHLEIDARYGRASTVRYGEKTLSYAYHDEGYIALEGSHPIERDVTFQYGGNEREIIANKPFRFDHVGKYVYLHAGWVRINSIKDLYTARVDFLFTHSGTETADIVTMNEIVLTGSPGLTMDRLEFEYVPLFS